MSMCTVLDLLTKAVFLCVFDVLIDFTIVRCKYWLAYYIHYHVGKYLCSLMCVCKLSLLKVKELIFQLVMHIVCVYVNMECCLTLTVHCALNS